jgi:hypothetical protein
LLNFVFTFLWIAGVVGVPLFLVLLTIFDDDVWRRP